MDALHGSGLALIGEARGGIRVVDELRRGADSARVGELTAEAMP
jgi:hypothetical protein